MKLQALLALFRHDAGDQSKPYLFGDRDAIAFLNEAEREACRRGDLLLEDRNPGMCQIPVKAGAQVPNLNDFWLRLTRAEWTEPAADAGSDPQRRELTIITDREVLDRRYGGLWRYEQGCPEWLLVEGDKLRIVQAPSADGLLLVEGYRLPLQEFAKPDDEPEIPTVHHRELVNWAIKLAFERPDSETRDPGRAKLAEDRFEAYFGPRKDSQLLQESEAAPHINRVFL